MPTCFAAIDEHLRDDVVENLLPHLRNVWVHRAPLVPYSNPVQDDARFCETLPSAISDATSVLCGVRTAKDRDELATIDLVVVSGKPCLLLVRSPDPGVYRQLGLIHRRTPFRAVIAVGGPNRVEGFFPGTKVFPVFDLEHGTQELAERIQAIVDETG